MSGGDGVKTTSTLAGMAITASVLFVVLLPFGLLVSVVISHFLPKEGS